MQKNKILFLYSGGVFLALLILGGCQMSRTGFAAQLETTPTPQSIVLTADLTNLDFQPDFRPVDPTDTGSIFPTATPDAGSGDPSGENGPVPLLRLPDDMVNILLLGSDQRPYDGGYRTDIIILVSIDVEEQTIQMISFPRDLYVYLPGYGNDRINAAKVRGSFPLLASTFEYNFGVRPDYYGMINFRSFRSLVDAMGGITVNVGRTFTDQRTGHGNYTVYAGSVYMDGETALWYVRGRTYSNDFDRNRRQQEVVQAIIRRMFSFDIVTKFPAMYEQFNGLIETNLPLSEVTPLLPVADEFIRGEIGTYAVDQSLITHWVTPSGSQVLLPNKPAILSLLKEVLNAK
jgi:LCP family protein required for cell wall assembly